MAGPKSGSSDRKEARAVDFVKTSQEAEATLEKRAAKTKAQKASHRSDAPETGDSPKRQAISWSTPATQPPERASAK
jgi:hypothetical protein